MKIITTRAHDWIIYQSAGTHFQSDELLKLNSQPTQTVLRDHHRSQVNKVDYDGQSFVIKSPNNKNKSLWIRFTTLYRDSEVLKDLKSQILLNAIGIKTVKPVAALEIRKYGMVVDSRIIYHYKPGAQITAKHLSSVISIMKRLHSNGYLHDDPHVKNFLHDDGKVFAIDCKPRNNLFGLTGVAHNFITLARRSNNESEIYRIIGTSPLTNLRYKIVNAVINTQQARRQLKNRLKLFLGIAYKQKNR